MNRLILASASPRRSELLRQIGIPFTVVKSTCEERICSTVPEEVVCALSRQKAEDVWRRIRSGETDMPRAEDEAYGLTAGDEDLVVIGADTVVAYEDRILGKPGDAAEARAMLTELSGSIHQVYTGVTFCYEQGGEERVHTFYERTLVEFYPMSPEEIEACVAAKIPPDEKGISVCAAEKQRYYWEGKAGGYGIQDPFGMRYVKRIDGDYYNVVGLPAGRLCQELKRLGIEV